jgi:transmembrane sensor
MKEFLPKIDELIAKGLTNETTDSEEIELTNWLNESVSNQQYYAELRRIWVSSADATPTLDVDTDKAWVAVQKRIHTRKPLTISRLSTSFVWKAAAAIALLVTATWFFTQQEKVIPPLSILADLTARKDTLTDGSIIELNKKSSIEYQPTKKERRVKMTGEAYFAVAPDKSKPFFIEVKNLEIQVVGTAFKVDNFSQTDKIIVDVEEGVVRLKGMNEEETFIKGNKAVYNTLTGKFEKDVEKKQSSIVQVETRLGVFDFNKIPIKNVIPKMSEYYNVSIDVEANVDLNCLMATTLNFNDPIKEILNIIKDSCEDIGLDYKKENGRYIIFKKE